jgi:hypothetical protein
MNLSDEEIREARLWWNQLDERTKCFASIWTILAMYARDWSEIHTVSFDAERKPRRIAEG